MLNDYFYMQGAKQANPQRHKVGWWLTRAVGVGRK